MKNRYYLMRHSESESNTQALISCDPITNLDKNGLTKKGIKQAQTSAQIFKKENNIVPIIISSDFLRAHETAKVVADVFSTNVELDTRLRERSFGEFSGKSIDNYKKIWKVSDQDPKAKPFGSESSEEVFERINAVIENCELRFIDENIILVSHGDPLVIVYSYFQHSVLTQIVHHFANAEIRSLK